MEMEKIINKTECDRCGKFLNRGKCISLFNEDVICVKCSKSEKNHHNYKNIMKDKETCAEKKVIIYIKIKK